MSDSILRQNNGVLDLVIVALLVGLTGVGLVNIDAGALLWVFGIPFLLFLPGYAIVSALFPEQPDSGVAGASRDSWNSTPDWVTRLGLSFVISAVTVAVIGFVLGWMEVLRLGSAVGAIVAVTAVSLGIAFIRRFRLPQERRGNPLAGRQLGFSTGTALQNLTLVVAVLALVGSVAFVGAVPSDGEAFTESYLLTEDADGDLVADDYPTTFVAGDGQPLSLGLENNEHRPVTYEVDVVVQELNADGTVLAEQRLDSFEVELAHGESAVVERDIAPTMTGEDLRLQFLVYKSDDTDSPDQTLQLWVDVIDEADE